MVIGVLRPIEEIDRCPNCLSYVDDCSCACPTCGEISACDCAIGRGVATGG